MSNELAASYFDKERIKVNPDVTYLSEKGAEQLIDWLDILIENGYNIENHRDIYSSAGFLIANGYSQVDFMTTAIMLGYASVVVDQLDDSE